MSHETTNETNNDPNNYRVEPIANPAAFYAHNSEELALVGADAFGQPVETFQAQVAERFDRAELAQVMRHGAKIVGFALYDMLRGGHWRPCLN
jgi:hypothetical protein